jgi:O-antigen ligase
VIAAIRREHTSRAWRLTAERALLAAFPAWTIGCVLVLWTVWRQKILVGLIAAVTLASPLAGLCTVAALTPFGAILERALDLPFRLSEEIVLAFLAAWLLRAGADRRGPRIPRVMRWSGWLLAVASLTSVAVLTYQRSRFPGELAAIATWVRQAYFINAEPIGLVDAMRLIEGLGLVAATLFLFRAHPRLAVSVPIALSAGAAMAATVGVLIHYGIGPEFLIARYSSLGFRTAFLIDPNAAGSYFVLCTCVALGMTFRATGSTRVCWLCASAVIGLGLWFAESRSALMAFGGCVVLGAGWQLSAARPLRTRVIVVCLLLAGAATAAVIQAELLQRDPTFRGGGFRNEFNEASVRMIATHPFRGVGIGQYYALSPLFLSPRMAFTYGHENAHDYFLQIGVELGVLGLLLFAVWIGSAALVAARALGVSNDARLLGVATGVAALVATSVVGHPLLVSEVSYPFWIAFGLVVGLAQSARLDAAAPEVPSVSGVRSRPLVFAATAGILIASMVIGELRDPIAPLDTFNVNGLYPREESDGRPYRWSSEYASVFVPASATRVYIPVRQPVDIHAISPMGVTVAVRGVVLFRTLVGSSWVDLDVALPPGDRSMGVTRVDLKIDRAWQPGVYVAGSSDLNPRGIQVADFRVVESGGL